MTNSIATTVLQHYFQGIFLEHCFGSLFFQDRGGLTYPNIVINVISPGTHSLQYE
jgi:hypothetical protein